MARVSFEFKKGDLVWIGLVVGLLCVGFGVAAWVDKPMFHDSEDVRVTIDGSDYSLQNASDLGLLGGGDFVHTKSTYPAQGTQYPSHLTFDFSYLPLLRVVQAHSHNKD